MSIVRVGLAETEKFAEGYDAIFGKKKAAGEKESRAAAGKKAAKKAPARASAAAKKPAGKKAARKKS